MKKGAVFVGRLPDVHLLGNGGKPRCNFFDIQVVADELHVNPNSPPPTERVYNGTITAGQIELQIVGWDRQAGLPVG